MDISTLIFDWGDTIMVDYNEPGPMWKWKKYSYIPGAEKALQILSRSYNTCIATSADHSDTEDMIKALKLVGADVYFKWFFSAHETGYKKPDPQFFKIVVERMKEHPARCIMIGNHYEKDIVGAHEAGLMTILFDAEASRKEFEKADVVVHSMDELPGAVSRIAQL